MFRNYLTVAVRNLLRHKVYSVINILGLSVGMACGILVLFYVQDEFKHASYHPNGHRIFKVWTERKLPSGESEFQEWQKGETALALRDKFPEIQIVGRAYASHFSKEWVRSGDKMFQQFFAVVDSEFLEMFHYPMLSGDISTALAQPGSVLITEAAAKRFFGDDNPIGKTVTNLKFGMDFRITGVLRDIPIYAHLRFDFLTLPHHPQASKQFKSNWDNWNKIYLMLPEGYSHLELEHKLRDFTARRTSEAVAVENILRLHSVNREYLYGFSGGPPRIGQIYQLTLFGVAVLLIACINFINLTTARSTGRAKEVGVRKVIGAYRRQLIVQFQCESLLLSFIAFVFAYALAELMFSSFYTLVVPYKKALGESFPVSLALGITDLGTIFLSLVGLVFIVGILAGSFPSLVLSAFQPVETLKGTMRAGTKSVGFRKGLIVFQFAISIFLILSTLVMDQQMRFVRHRDLGFDKDHVVLTPIFDEDPSLRNRYETIRQTFLQHPNVLQAATSQRVPVEVNDVSSVYLEGDPNNERKALVFGIDENFLDTYGMRLVAGRNLNLSIASDSSKAFILNETAVKAFGWTDPIGKLITWGSRQGRVIGVVKDFHYRSLRHPIGPAVLLYGQHYRLSLRISPYNIPETMAFLQNTWSKWIPHKPPEFYFLDEWIAVSYQEEERLSRILSWSSGLAILVACLGLFGLASFTVMQRTKEIGIRKVLGASVSNIVLLLSKEFVVLVAVANLIAWPVVYYAMSRWLQDFVYRIELGPEVFILGGMLALVIALVTVSAQAIKAAQANPVDALRYE